MAKNIVTKIDDEVAVRHVLVSVSDKAGLESFIPALVEVCRGLMIYSTGGTFSRLEQILGGKAKDHLKQVSEYTGQPEMQGGLVKTLDFKIYLGLLSETYNDAHVEDLKRTSAVTIDMVVVNLYPFRETIARSGVTPEEARANIDIGGPCMIRASAKNFLRVAPVVDPADYPRILEELRGKGGKIGLALRYELARKAFEHTASYDRAISDYLARTDISQVEKAYPELVR
jgi:phosphoribosylaminoimidazolecarboxamide formyltransferase/IMP cyclohydrolase